MERIKNGMRYQVTHVYERWTMALRDEFMRRVDADEPFSLVAADATVEHWDRNNGKGPGNWRRLANNSERNGYSVENARSAIQNALAFEIEKETLMF